jgi:hypothetical protein
MCHQCELLAASVHGLVSVLVRAGLLTLEHVTRLRLFRPTTARRRARADAAACMLPTNACCHSTFCPLTLTCGTFAAASTLRIPDSPPALSSSCCSKLAVTWSAFRLRAHRIIENVCVLHFPVRRVAVRGCARRGRVFQGSVSVEIVGRVYPETLL